MSLEQGFIRERIESLRKDVANCLRVTAPFPALLYCFATVDFLGALASGNATPHAPTSAQAAKYMRRFMGYTPEQVRLLQRQFRHKLVHLAQPKPLVEDRGRLIAWRYWHERADRHLQLIPWPAAAQESLEWVAVAPSGLVPVPDFEFNVSIAHLVQDIVISAAGPGGLLEGLREQKPGSELHRRTRRAVEQLLDPKQ